MNPSAYNLLVVLGPTASGKTRLAVELASQFSGEILSADSRQVYRGLNLGAGKDPEAYEIAGRRIPSHLIDIADLSREFSLFDFLRAFYAAYAEVRARKLLPILAGGTGLYLQAVLAGYRLSEVPPQPELRAELSGLPDAALVDRLRRLRGSLHNTTDTRDRQRLIRAIEIAEYSQRRPAPELPSLTPLILGIRWSRDVLRERIRIRLRKRLEAGLIPEVAHLHDQGVTWERLRQLGLEYRFGADFLTGGIASPAELEEKLRLAICDFAKRQETWFRRLERKGAEIHWLESADPDAAAQWIREKWSGDAVPGVPEKGLYSRGEFV